ncbi:hypothetical protein EB796_021324 [Bugula neritina]|uniref:Fibronectin type-III domain-containing protein n=1 Tax=Bugula neritina TaxID=10212 RepID=A0A7J7J2D8_BUGNE|nr:hypothetical protein EB796_021324 [Bugula neritina]
MVFAGEASYVLQNVEVLSTANDSLSDIAKSHAEWDSLLFISKQTAEVTELVQPARAAQFVAIFALREGSIFLAEVEIYGYALGDFQPTELQFTDVDSSSIMLGWEPPDNNDTIQVEYQFTCDDEDTWTKTAEGPTATYRGLSVSEFKDGVNCRVRVETYSETVASAFLQCSGAVVVVIAAAIIAVFMVRKRRQSNKETPIESTETESSAETHKAPVAAGDSDQDRIYDTPCATDVIYENRRTYENWQAQEANETQSCVVPQYCNTGAYNSVADGGYTSPSFSNAAHFYGSQSTLTGTADDSTDHISSRPADLELAQMRANLRPVNTQLQ